MISDASTEHSWTCPACGRQVPNRIDTCRCGQRRETVPREEPSRAGSGRQVPRLAWAAVIAIAALAFWLGYSSRSPVPQSGAEAPPGSGTSGVRAAQASPDPREPSTETPPMAAAWPEAEPAPPPAGAAPEAAPPRAAPTTLPTAPVQASLEDVAQRTMLGVVRVESAAGTGSGFFVAADIVLTNAHVVPGAPSVTIRRADGSTSPAYVAASSPEVDLAALRVASPVPAQPVLPLGSVSRVRVGQEVLAAGSPLGVLQNSVTRGIVSAVRVVGGVTLVQTDAAINRGNSGGPIVTRDGAVIGIATMQVAAQQGLSFAVAADHAQALLAGRPSATGGGTPISNLDRAINEAGAPSVSEVREDGTREYERFMTELAKRADIVDVEWARFKSACYSLPVNGSFDREWFAVYEPRALPGPVGPGCDTWLNDVRRAAEEVRARVRAQDEAARRAGVYPGVQRDIRSRLRLEYEGWNR